MPESDSPRNSSDVFLPADDACRRVTSGPSSGLIDSLLVGTVNQLSARADYAGASESVMHSRATTPIENPVFPIGSLPPRQSRRRISAESGETSEQNGYHLIECPVWILTARGADDRALICQCFHHFCSHMPSEIQTIAERTLKKLITYFEVVGFVSGSFSNTGRTVSVNFGSSGQRAGSGSSEPGSSEPEISADDAAAFDAQDLFRHSSVILRQGSERNDG